MSSKELLAEYATLAAKLRHINETLQEMNSLDVVQLIDKIRVVERKMGLVYTLFRSSVYSVLVQDQDQQQTPQQQAEVQNNEEEDESQPFSHSIQQPGISSQGLNGSGDGYATKDLRSSTGRNAREQYTIDDNDNEPVSSSQAVDDYDSLPSHHHHSAPPPPATATLPQTPSRYQHYRSDPLLESTYRRASQLQHRQQPSAEGTLSTTSHDHRHSSSNVLGQYEAITGQRSLLSRSRGYSRRPPYDGSALGSTNRPRYH